MLLVGLEDGREGRVRGKEWTPGTTNGTVVVAAANCEWKMYAFTSLHRTPRSSFCFNDENCNLKR